MIIFQEELNFAEKRRWNHVPADVGPRVLSCGEHVLDAIFAHISAILDE